MQAKEFPPRAEVLKPRVLPFLDTRSQTFSYVVQDPTSNACAIIDSVLDFEPQTGEVQHRSADAIVRYIETKKLEVAWIIETHLHADHLTAAQYLKDVLGGRIAIGEYVRKEQGTFASLLNIERSLATDGSQFDHLFKNDEEYFIGNMQCLALHTPGHTPSCMSHLIGNAAFVGDTLMMPDVGTARTDLPGGDARQLFHSIRKILRLPGRTRLYLCHDSGCASRPHVEYQTTVSEQRQVNILMNERTRESEFVSKRKELDSGLPKPEAMFASVQVNIRGGHLPPPETNEVSYLKIPVAGLAGKSRD